MGQHHLSLRETPFKWLTQSYSHNWTSNPGSWHTDGCHAANFDIDRTEKPWRGSPRILPDPFAVDQSRNRTSEPHFTSRGNHRILFQKNPLRAGGRNVQFGCRRSRSDQPEQPCNTNLQTILEWSAVIHLHYYDSANKIMHWMRQKSQIQLKAKVYFQNVCRVVCLRYVGTPDMDGLFASLHLSRANKPIKKVLYANWRKTPPSFKTSIGDELSHLKQTQKSMWCINRIWLLNSRI